MALAALLAGGCEEQLPELRSRATATDLPAPPDAGPRPLVIAELPEPDTDRAAVRKCHEGLVEGLKAVEAAPPHRRAAPALAAIGQACTPLFSELGAAAKRASVGGRAARARALLEGCVDRVPTPCLPTSPDAPASTVAGHCPPPKKFPLAPPLLEDLDAGTYLYVRILRSDLEAMAVLDSKTERVLMNLVLGAALDRGGARGK
jgi:hypothetical protein